MLPRGRALDVACGSGRNALLLARLGFRVDAIDFSLNALMRARAAAHREALPLRLIQADLESFPLRAEHYDLIVQIRYLQRSLYRTLKQALRPGGHLVIETFLLEQRELGHPTDPSFLLEHDELRDAFADLEIIRYEEGLFQTESGPAHLARLLARRAAVPR